MEEEEIRCFQHCDRDKNILCFTVPLTCPLCGADLTQSRLRIPPYIINSPFTDATYTQCCLVIKPTVGHFLYDFNNNSNLHIGLTDSTGNVYEFDERGVVVGDGNWKHCLSVEVMNDQEESETDWDEGLEQFIKDHRWNRECYDDSLLNCYDFVLNFLRWIGLDRQYPCLGHKSLFCEEMILPASKRAGKYISLYRQLKDCGAVVQNTGYLR